MNKSGTKNLYTHRCYLRRLEVSDSYQLFENVYSDSKVSGYMSWDCYSDVNAVEDYLTKWQEYYNKNECYWGVFLKENDTLIRTLRMRDKTAFGIEDCLSYSLLKNEMKCF